MRVCSSSVKLERFEIGEELDARRDAAREGEMDRSSYDSCMCGSRLNDGSLAYQCF